MEIYIDRLNDDGEGVGKILSGDNSGKICFVSNALPSETVDIDIIESNKKFCRAKVNTISSPSINRVQPSCPYFLTCGGCDIQHMSSSLQNDFKINKIKNSFRRIAKLDVSVSNVVSSGNFNYRNKMVFPFSFENGQVLLGMYKSNSHHFISIDKCFIANEDINKVLSISKNYFMDNKSLFVKSEKSLLKYLVVRSVDNQILVTIVATNMLDLSSYYQVLSDNFNNIGLSIIVSNNDKDILGGRYKYLFGLEKITLNEFGIKYSIDNRSFFQVNTEVKKMLYNAVLSQIDKNSFVVDGYSGAGLLTAIISKKCNYSVGVEINKSATKSAEELKELNDLNNVEYINADFKTVFEKYLKNREDMVILLDPPRDGCDKIIMEKLSNFNAKKIIYISCNPDSLARDIAILGDSYEISSIIPFDMFPQTKHIETLVCLQRRV